MNARLRSENPVSVVACIGSSVSASQQSIAMLDRDTGEIVAKTLGREGGAVREFYASIPRPVVVGIEATSSMASVAAKKTYRVRQR